VWWTSPKATAGAYCGAARRIFSSAPQDSRVMIGGESAIESRRGGRPSDGLLTK
jgi:hypothetical protein